MTLIRPWWVRAFQDTMDRLEVAQKEGKINQSDLLRIQQTGAKYLESVGWSLVDLSMPADAGYPPMAVVVEANSIVIDTAKGICPQLGQVLPWDRNRS